ncbi:MAG: amidohydrolase family protein, partial [Armatimonadota bacterium]
AGLREREGEWVRGKRETAMIIDTHAHIGLGERLSDTYQVDQSVEVVLQQMAEAGVDKTCVMPVAYVDYAAAIEEVREAVAAHPDKLIGYARVNLNHRERASAQLQRCFEMYGFRGVKIHPGSGDGFPTRWFMEMMGEYGRPLLLHTTPDLAVIDAITHLARSYPKVPVICGHMGGFGVFNPGFVKLLATEAKQIENLYLDTAFVFLHQWIGMAVEICGPEKVLLGSDGPVLHPAIPLKQIELCHFSDSERGLILGGNASKLLGL